MFRIKTYFCVLFLYTGFLTNAQDPYLSIKPAMPMLFNPAYAGNEYYTRASLSYRNHYPASGTAFATYSASFDKYIDKYNSGIGLALMNDQFGSKTYSYTSASLVYSYRITVGQSNFIKAGLMANLYYGTNNPNDLTFADMINPDGTVEPNPFTYDKQSAFGADFGFGGLFNSDYFEAGAAVYHLGKENKSVYWSRPLRIYAHAEWEIPIFSSAKYVPSRGITRYLENSTLKPNIFFIRQAEVNLFGAGALYNFLNFNLGLYSRQNFRFNSFTTSFHVGYISDIMDVHYVFDLSFTGKNYRGINTSSHEIGLVFKFSTGKEFK
ncbi:MAG: PorP/SprF family type IX secretion system membrane protein [Prevotellaceae bacterium]|nr:PorP/SprF family type IX secretion system membrane protein [Prevotellaceae bacterium]